MYYEPYIVLPNNLNRLMYQLNRYTESKGWEYKEFETMESLKAFLRTITRKKTYTLSSVSNLGNLSKITIELR
jgi:hypothetical protein